MPFPAQQCGCLLVEEKVKESLGSLQTERGQPLPSLFRKLFCPGRFYLLSSRGFHRAGHTLLVLPRPPADPGPGAGGGLAPPREDTDPAAAPHRYPAPLCSPRGRCVAWGLCQLPFLVWDNERNDRSISSRLHFCSLQVSNPYSPSGKSRAGDAPLSSYAPKPPT